MAARVPANLTPNIDLLQKDVLILFQEVRRLRTENENLKKTAKNTLVCPECGASMVEKKPEHYKCPKCGAHAKQITIFDNDERGELAYYIKNQRIAMGLTIPALARLLGISRDTLYNYENGKGRVDNMDRIAHLLRDLRRGKANGNM